MASLASLCFDFWMKISWTDNSLIGKKRQCTVVADICSRLVIMIIKGKTSPADFLTDLSSFKQFAELSKDAKFKCTYNWLNFYYPNSQFGNNFLSFGAIIKAKIDWLMETAGDLFFGNHEDKACTKKSQLLLVFSFVFSTLFHIHKQRWK